MTTPSSPTLVIWPLFVDSTTTSVSIANNVGMLLWTEGVTVMYGVGTAFHTQPSVGCPAVTAIMLPEKAGEYVLKLVVQIADGDRDSCECECEKCDTECACDLEC